MFAKVLREMHFLTLTKESDESVASFSSCADLYLLVVHLDEPQHDYVTDPKPKNVHKDDPQIRET